MLDYFESYKKEAFRLETLPRYNVADDVAAFQKFMNGEMPEPLSIENNDFIKTNAARIAGGAQYIRARVLSDDDYMRFLLHWAYGENEKIGTEYFFIAPEDYHKILSDLELHDINDFWLFDKKAALDMKYDSENRWLSSKEISDEKYVADRVRLRDEILKRGFGLEELRKRVS